MRLAMNTMELMIQKMILNFEFFPGKISPRPIMAMTLTSPTGMLLKVRKIKQ
jgi:hypothetical protein